MRRLQATAALQQDSAVSPSARVMPTARRGYGCGQHLYSRGTAKVPHRDLVLVVEAQPVAAQASGGYVVRRNVSATFEAGPNAVRHLVALHRALFLSFRMEGDKTTYSDFSSNRLTFARLSFAEGSKRRKQR